MTLPNIFSPVKYFKISNAPFYSLHYQLSQEEVTKLTTRCLNMELLSSGKTTAFFSGKLSTEKIMKY